MKRPISAFEILPLPSASINANFLSNWFGDSPENTEQNILLASFLSRSPELSWSKRYQILSTICCHCGEMLFAGPVVQVVVSTANPSYNPMFSFF